MRAGLLSKGVILGLLLLFFAVAAGCARAAAPTPPPTAAPAPVAAPTAAPATAPAPVAAPTAVATPTPAPVAAPKEQPRYGGVLRRFQGSDPTAGFDIRDGPPRNHWPYGPVHNSLLTWNTETGQLEGLLAERWEVGKGGTEITLKLRPGVKFHDGQPVTVDDVLASLDRIYNPNNPFPYGLIVYFRAVQKVEAVDASTVRLQLEYPSAIVLASLADIGSAIVPKKLLDANKFDLRRIEPVGTGPFKFKSFQPGVAVEVTRNATYWRPGRPYLDGIQTFIIGDRAAQLAAFRSGRVETIEPVLDLLTPGEIPGVKASVPNLQLWRAPTGRVLYAPFNTTKKPFDDVRVRKALFLVVDRQAAIKVLADGQGSLGSIWPDAGYGLPPEELVKLPGYRQPKDADVAEAKRLLAEAGYTRGFTMDIVGRAGTKIDEDHGIFLSGEFGKIGVTAKVTPLESAVSAALKQRKGEDISVFTPSGRIADPSYQVRFHQPGQTAEPSYIVDKELEDLWIQFGRILDVPKRQEISRQIEARQFTQTFQGIPTVRPFQFFGAWPHVRDWGPAVTTYTHSVLGFEQVWLAPR